MSSSVSDTRDDVDQRADLVDATMVHVSRIFDRLRRMCLDKRGSDCVNTSGNSCRQILHQNESAQRADMHLVSRTRAHVSETVLMHTTKLLVANRMQNFGGRHQHTLNPQIVEGLVRVLDENNRLVRLFRTARDRCSAGDIPWMKIRLYSKSGIRGYELSSYDLLGGIIFEDGPKSRTDFDVIIQLRGGPPQSVNKEHQSYMSLQYHLLFVFNQPGFYPEMGLKPKDASGQEETEKEFRLDRWSCYQEHLQVDLEIKRYMARHPGLTRSDRADIVCRVFEQKVNDFISFVYNRVSEKRFAALSYAFMDRILAKVSKPIGDTSTSTDKERMEVDEIKNYVDGQNMQRVSFRNRDRIDIIVNMPGKKKTTLTEWYVYNDQNTDGRHLTYLDFPFEVAWSAKTKSWHRRGVNPQMKYGLLTGNCYNLPGRISNEVVDETLVCICKTTSQRKYQKQPAFQTTRLTPPQLQDYILYELETIITRFGKSVKDFRMPLPPRDMLEDLKNKLLIEERNYRSDLLSQDVVKLVPKLNRDQKEVFTLITTAFKEGRQELLFVYGHGGTGKTFLWKTIISLERSQGKIILAVASSGIASLLLLAGRIAHSRFKLPLDLTDESAMFKALDRPLRDLMNAPEIVFGGKTVILGGDFRQTLPVKKGAAKEELIYASIANSYLWPHFKVYMLRENMRLLRSDLSDEQRKRSEVFAKWLLDVDNGEIGENDQQDDEDTSQITLPQEYCIDPGKEGLSELINFIYDDATLKAPTASTLQEKAIVCPKNETTDEVNAKILSSTKGVMKTYISRDEAIPLGKQTSETEMLYPMEYLNTLTFPGFPPHELQLKVETPIMMLRNVNLSEGLCNDTRMIVTSLMSRLIKAQIIT
ncbi:DNA helicase [Tanacetum coccineum]